MESSHGDVIGLVCFRALLEADLARGKARLRCRLAAYVLRTARKKLNPVLKQAYRQQSFGPLRDLFDQEETALAVYEAASAKVSEAEARWRALRTALAYEKEQLLAQRLFRRRPN